MHYIARDENGGLLDHTMSDNRLTTLLAAFRYQVQNAVPGRDGSTAAYDYPVVEVSEVSEVQYTNAQQKDMAHFERLLAE